VSKSAGTSSATTFNADPTSPFYDPVPVPDPDPDDCQGHGTHVAGIVGANGDAVGVAPEVTFGAYRVFGCDGSTTADIMIAAMERALADDMDILNMSIGSAFTWPQYPTAVASDLLVDAGMVVVASIGNSGASGTFSAGAPGLGEKVIGVAAFENLTATFPVAEVLGDGQTEPTDVGHAPWNSLHRRRPKGLKRSSSSGWPATAILYWRILRARSL
jgi:minor extracellular serine protease Vpr